MHILIVPNLLFSNGCAKNYSFSNFIRGLKYFIMKLVNQEERITKINL